jgi:hypothetical protein
LDKTLLDIWFLNIVLYNIIEASLSKSVALKNNNKIFFDDNISFKRCVEKENLIKNIPHENKIMLIL